MLYPEYINTLPYSELNTALEFLKKVMSVTTDWDGISKLFWMGATTRQSDRSKERKLSIDDLALVVRGERVIMLSHKYAHVIHGKPVNPTTYKSSMFEIRVQIFYDPKTGTLRDSVGVGATFDPTKHEDSGLVVEGSIGGSWWVPKPYNEVLADLQTAIRKIKDALPNREPYEISTVDCPNPVALVKQA